MTTYQERMRLYQERASELMCKNNTEDLKRAASLLAGAERIIIGGAAGLSAADGLDYQSEEILHSKFPALGELGYRTLWEALWDDSLNRTQKWSIHAAEIFWAYYDMPILPVYQNLLDIMKEKDYFVLSSNIDEQFVKAGFDEEKVFSPQNSMIRFQCSVPCCRDIWDGRKAYEWIQSHTDMSTFSCQEEDLPRCPHCGAPAVWNMRGRDCFIPDEVMRLRPDFERYVEEAREMKTVFLELGAGLNSPGVIRHPFQRLTALYPDAMLIRMNRDFPCVPDKIRDKSIEIGGDMGEAIEKIKNILI